MSTSRYSGTNNVFFDPASPITHYSEDNNGTEDVSTESLAGSWTSAWTNHLSTNLRGQYSHDNQQSFANSDATKVKIYGRWMGRVAPASYRDKPMSESCTLPKP